MEPVLIPSHRVVDMEGRNSSKNEQTTFTQLSSIGNKVAFVTPSSFHVTNLFPHSFHSSFCRKSVSVPKRGRVRNAAATKMVIDPTSVGTGYAFLNSLKGVVIGPTVNEIMAAFCGGTVGVMSTIIALEVNRQKVKERKQCPYCHGAGTIPCATCYSMGYVPSVNVMSAQEGCTSCGETGYLQCNHCEGDGRLIPWVYERAMRSQFEDYVYTAVDDYYQDQPPYV